MATRNFTLSLPKDVVRRARVLAAQQDTSVSALVSDYVKRITEDGIDYDTIWAREERLMAEGIGLEVGPITWSRANVHER